MGRKKDEFSNLSSAFNRQHNWTCNPCSFIAGHSVNRDENLSPRNRVQGNNSRARSEKEKRNSYFETLTVLIQLEELGQLLTISHWIAVVNIELLLVKALERILTVEYT